MRQTLFNLVASLALMACVPEVPPDTCGAADYAALLGQPIAAVTLPADLDDRVIEENSAVTLDFRPTRINFRLDGEGKIQEITCG